MKRFSFALLCIVAMAESVSAQPKDNATGTEKAGSQEKPEQCKVTPIAPLDVLVAKASLSTVVALTSTPECRNTLALEPLLAFTSGNTRVLARPYTEAANPREIHFEFENVEAVAGSHDWTVASVTSTKIEGVTMTLEVVNLETKSLVLSFLAVTDGRRQIERKAPDLTAAARTSMGWRKNPIITNAATLSVPDRLVAPTGYRWRAIDSTWGRSVAFHCIDSDSQVLLELLPRANDVCHVRPDRIMFGVQRRMKSSLDVELELWKESTAAMRGSARAVIRTRLLLANEARAESLPLPLWRIAKVTCTSERLLRSSFATTAKASQIMAIDDDAVTAGKCYLTINFDHEPVFHPVDRNQKEADRRLAVEQSSCSLWNEQLRLAGPQNVEMTIKRGGTSITRQFQVEPPTGVASCDIQNGAVTVNRVTTDEDGVAVREPAKEQASISEMTKPDTVYLEIPIPAPKSDGGSGDYAITLKLKGSSEVHYFDGSLDEVNIEGNVDANAAFTLRPRGPHSTTYPIRISVTLAVTPLSLRFPARARDIPMSSSPTNAHLEGPRTALIGVLELWDYARNASMVPVQLQGGLSLLRIEEKPLDLNTLLGITVAFPFAGEGRTETSISIGGFWEHELFGTHSNGWLVTASVDLFKVAVAKPGGS